MNDIGLKPEKLCRMTTDGAPSMVGRTNVVVSLVEKVRQDAGATAKLFRSQCIIHQENLCGKSVKMQNVMSVVVKTMNFVRARGLNHRQFRHLLAEMNAQYQDLLYYCEVEVPCCAACMNSAMKSVCSWSRKVQQYPNSRIPHGCATLPSLSTSRLTSIS